MIKELSLIVHIDAVGGVAVVFSVTSEKGLEKLLIRIRCKIRHKGPLRSSLRPSKQGAPSEKV